MRATCSASLILRDSITLIMLDEVYKLCSSSLFSLLQPHTYTYTRAHRFTAEHVFMCYEVGDIILPGVRVLVGAGNFSLHHRVQTGAVAHPASYSTGRVAFSWG